MQFQQISFTRVNGVGWRVVNEPKGLSETAIKSFSSIQNGNTKSPQFDKEDMQKKITTELTVSEECDCVYFSRIRSDSGVDEAGRPIMFSNCFVGSLDEFVRDPLAVLNIDGSNYRFTIDETVEMPEHLKIRDYFTLKEAITSLGFTEDKLIYFAKCIYSVVTQFGRNSRFRIICDCKEETIAKYMYIAYKLLPVELRKKLSFSTYETQLSTPKTILFERTVKKRDSAFFDISKSEKANTVLSLDEYDELSSQRYRFIDALVLDCWENGSCDELLEKIDHQMKLFGIEETDELYFYRVAYNYMRFSEKADAEHKSTVLTNRLNELLNIPNANSYVDEQVFTVFSKILNGNVEMSEKLRNKILKRIAKTQNNDLKECGSRFICNTLLTMERDEAAKYLYENYPDKNSGDYIGVEEVLRMTPEGRDIIDYMWVFAAKSVPATSEGILDFYNESKDVANRVAIELALKDIIFRYIDYYLGKGVPIRQFMDNVADLISEVKLSSYSKEIKDYVLKSYWNNFKFSRFESASYADMRNAVCEYLIDGERHCKAIFLILQIIDENFKFCQFTRMENNVNSLIELIDDDDKKYVCRMILDAGVEIASSLQFRDPNFVDGWFMLFDKFDYTEVNPARFMIEHNVYQFTENLCTIAETDASHYLADPEFVKKVIGWLSTCGYERTPSGNSVEDMISALNEKIKPKKKGIFGFGKNNT